MKKLLLISSLVGLGCSFAMAQYDFYNKPVLEKWYSLGVNHFYGDLGGKQLNGTTIAGYDDFDFSNLQAYVGLGVRYNPTRWLAFRVGGSYTRFKQADINSFNPYIQKRNLSFQTNIFGMEALTEFKVAKFGIHTKKRKSHWEYYVFGGVGAVYYNPKTSYEGKHIALRPLGTEGQGLRPNTKRYSAFAASVPVGGGLRFGTGFNSSWFVELGYRITTSDYIDDVSGNYYNYEELLIQRGKASADLSYRGNDATYPSGRIRGNPFNKDSFLVINVGFSAPLKSRSPIRFHGR